MVSPFCNDNRNGNGNRKPYVAKHPLHSLGAGLALFLAMCLYSKVKSTPICLLKRIFGISCPGCGMTRAFLAILQMDFRQAISYNILSIPLFAGILIYSLCAIIDRIFHRTTVEHIERQMAKPYMFFIYAILFVLVIVSNNIHKSA